ncbi:MAG TPA: thioredoxin family protein [Blastocatellia bacterium]|nr:thioredoxin family protein [Blastocatellia bacterium]
MRLSIFAVSIIAVLLIGAGTLFFIRGTVSTDRSRGGGSLIGVVAAHAMDASPNAPLAAPHEIDWEIGLNSALRSASNGNRVVVVDVYTDWCGWCKKMDETIYHSPAVAALGRDAVFLKMNAEDHGEGERFARQNGVTGYPTTILLDSSGNAIRKSVGYIASPADFIGFVKSASANRS